MRSLVALLFVAALVACRAAEVVPAADVLQGAPAQGLLARALMLRGLPPVCWWRGEGALS